VAEALSRWAYPASSAREDVSLHGSLDACKEVERMMLKKASELKETAVLRISRKQGMEVKTEGVVDAVTRSQMHRSPRKMPRCPWRPIIKASQADRIRPVLWQFQRGPIRFLIQTQGTPKPKARPVIPHGKGVLNQNCDRKYRNCRIFPKFGGLLSTMPIIGLWVGTN